MSASLERVKRLLVLIPYVAKRPDGVPVDEALAFAGCRSEEELCEDIECAQMIAVPPGSPADYVDIYLERGRVFAFLPQSFSKPPRLSVVEAAALMMAAEPLLGAAGGTLERTVGKLRRAFPPGCEESVEELLRCATLEAGPPPECYHPLAEAIDQCRETEIEYWSLSTNKAGPRTVEPRRLYLSDGNWYLAADVVGLGKEHVYRLDRISGVTLGERRFEPKPSPAPEGDKPWRGPAPDIEIEVRFAESIAGLVLDQYGKAAKRKPDGSVTLVTKVAGEAYAIGWVLGFGGEAEIVRPEGLRRRLAERVAELHRQYA